MSVTPLEIMCGVAAIVLAIYYYLTAPFNFWKSRNVPGPEPIPAFGNFKDVLFARISLGEFLKNVYDKYPGAPFIGIFGLREPILLVNDPDLLKDVFIKDFTNFSDRANGMREKAEPLSMHLFNLDTERWRALRTKLSPTFTSGKLKQMFYLLLECGEHLEKYIGDLSDKGDQVDCREVTAKFTTDVIGCCAFGLQMNALDSEESKFREMGKKIFQTDMTKRFRLLTKGAVPWLDEMLGPSSVDQELTDFFTNTLNQTMDHRRKNKIIRHDFVDLLMELKDNPEKTDFELTDHLITAQAFVFFTAGFETSSTTMSHALYELAQNHAIQDMLREEIKEVLKRNDDKLTYESIKEMKYLDMIFKETLRKYPPVPWHMRQAMKDYTFAGTNVQIPKGQTVWVPIYGIQHDPKYYPKPEVFDPERFTEKACEERHPMTYMPFGDGPRNCIGARFAIYQTKVGLIKLLTNHKVDVCEKTEIQYVIDPKSFLLSPVGGTHLKFDKMK